MANQNHTSISSNTKTLELITKTYKSNVVLSDDYMQKIKRMACNFVRKYMLMNENSSMSAYIQLVERRLVNLTAEGIEDGTIGSLSDVNKLMDQICTLKIQSEIIAAYKSGHPDAMTYIYVFFSLKVYSFMEQHGQLNKEYSQDLYADLMLELLNTIEEHVCDEYVVDEETGTVGYGLTKTYLNHMFHHCLENSKAVYCFPISMKRHQVSDTIRLLSNLTPSERSNLSKKDIAKKYNVTKTAVDCYDMCHNSVSYDDLLEHSNDTALTHNEVAYEEVESRESLLSLYDELQDKYNIDAYVWKSIYTALVNFIETDERFRQRENGFTQNMFKFVAEKAGTTPKNVKLFATELASHNGLSLIA